MSNRKRWLKLLSAGNQFNIKMLRLHTHTHTQEEQRREKWEEGGEEEEEKNAKRQ